MKRLWFSLYTRDWLGDTQLRSVSYGARGLWIDMLCLMDGNEERPGYLDILPPVLLDNQKDNQAKKLIEELARLTCGKMAETQRYLTELEAKKVFSRDDKGTIFSRRMVRSAAISQIRQVVGKQGGNPKLKSGLVNQKDNQTPNQNNTQPQQVLVNPHIPEAINHTKTNTAGDAIAPPIDPNPVDEQKRIQGMRIGKLREAWVSCYQDVFGREPLIPSKGGPALKRIVNREKRPGELMDIDEDITPVIRFALKTVKDGTDTYPLGGIDDFLKFESSFDAIKVRMDRGSIQPTPPKVNGHSTAEVSPTARLITLQKQVEGWKRMLDSIREERNIKDSPALKQSSDEIKAKIAAAQAEIAKLINFQEVPA